MEWISTKDKLPEKNGWYGSKVWATDGKNQFTAYYTTGKELNVEDYEELLDLDCDEISGDCFLKHGWYELTEQHGSQYDFIYLQRNVTHWMPLPEPPIY